MSSRIADLRSGIHLQQWVVGIGVFLMIIKGTAWRITDSNAILSDALESLVNVSAGAFTLYGLWRALRPADDKHPYGQGKMEVLTALFEGWFVVLAGSVIAGRAIEALLVGSSVHRITAGIVLTSVAGVVNMGMGLALKRRGRTLRSLAMEAGGLHLMSDAWSTVAMLGGLVLIALTGLQWIDAVLAFAFGVFILVQGARVLRTAARRVLDVREPELHRLVAGLLSDREGTAHLDVGRMRVQNHGTVLVLDLPVSFPTDVPLDKAALELRTLERELSNGLGMVVQLRASLAAGESVFKGARSTRSVEEGKLLLLS